VGRAEAEDGRNLAAPTPQQDTCTSLVAKFLIEAADGLRERFQVGIEHDDAERWISAAVAVVNPPLDDNQASVARRTSARHLERIDAGDRPAPDRDRSGVRALGRPSDRQPDVGCRPWHPFDPCAPSHRTVGQRVECPVPRSSTALGLAEVLKSPERLFRQPCAVRHRQMLQGIT